MNLPSEQLPLVSPKAYYDKHAGGYWYQDSKGTWIRLKETDFIRFLKVLGFNDKPYGPEIQSPVDQALMSIQMDQNVDYVGPLAGYQPGLIEMEGQCILIDKGPKIIRPAAGTCPILQAILMGMFGKEQLAYFNSWSKIAYDSLASGHLRSGQAVVFAGPVDSGKSLVQGLITKLLGGRGAHPYLNMTGGTAFNSELFGAEHLIIDDQSGCSDYKSRQRLTAQFKMVTAAGSQQCHPKGKPALTLRPFWRLTVSVNDNPESLTVLPLMGEDLEDKVMLFKVEHHEMPMPIKSNQEREAFWHHMMLELPHWIHYLVHEWQIPPELEGNRFGMRHYHHPDVIGDLDALSPEMKLLDLIEKAFRTASSQLAGVPSNKKTIIQSKEWKDTASELESYLTRKDSDTEFDAKKLLRYPTNCGQFLERLSRKCPEIIIRDKRINNQHYWRIDYRALAGRTIDRTLARPDDLALRS
jgi:hypothetical protein